MGCKQKKNQHAQFNKTFLPLSFLVEPHEKNDRYCNKDTNEEACFEWKQKKTFHLIILWNNNKSVTISV